MKQFYIYLMALVSLFAVSAIPANAQTTLNTTAVSGFSNNNGSGMTVFNFQNTNPFSITITDIEGIVGTAGATSVDLWIRATPLTGTTMATNSLTTANGWVLAATGTFTGVANTTTLTTQPMLTGISVDIPANSTYAMAIAAYSGTSGRLRYHTLVSPNLPSTTVSGGGCNILMGNGTVTGPPANVSFGSASAPPGTTAFNLSRAFLGKITFTSNNTPCTTPPTGGAATANPSTPVCAFSPVALNLTGNSFGTGQTYVWQKSTDAAPPHNWTDVTTSSASSATTVNPTVTTFYRAALTCGGATRYSDSIKVLVNPALPAGTYTIDPGMPTSGNNYQTFTEAANALTCGIAGPVVFNVAAGAIFNEQVTIPPIANTSNTNTVTFKGNLATISFNSTNTANRCGLILNGSDHVIIDSLNVIASGTYGWGILLTNKADSNRISNCNITVSTSSTTSADFTGIIITGSTSSASTSGDNGNGNIIEGNTVTGGYYGIYLYGSTTPYNLNNIVRNNMVKDYYYYSIYNYGQQFCTISGNDISRPSRTTFSSYNVYISTNNGGIKVEKNKIHDLYQAGSGVSSILYNIYIGASATVTNPNSVENNLVYNINNSSGTIYGVYNASSYSYWNFYHNTIVLDDPGSVAAITYGMYITGTTGVNVKNNIVYINRGGNGTKYCLYYSTVGVTSSNNNVLYMGSTLGTNGIGYFNSGKTTLTDWQTTGFDAASSAANPQFPGGGDYTPAEATINNIGATGLGVTTDITGATRAANPDPGAIEFSIAGTDASITWIAPVMPVTAGLKTITVGITNNSASGNLNSVNLSYTDGNTITTQNFTGLNIAPAATQNLSFTTQYNVNGNVTLRAYINLVNGTMDLSQANDTTTQSLCFSLNGNYTINQTLPSGGTNFATFAEAMNALTCGGVTGPVTFNVAQGTGPYTEKIVIPAFSGASATNKVTIKGNLETIAFNTNDANNRTAVVFNGADHVILDSLNVDVSGGTYGWGIVLMNQADSNIIRNCTITSNITATSTNYMGIQLNGSATSTSISGNNGNGNLIEKNTVIGGYYGIYLYGATAPYNLNNTVSNNVVRDFYYYSIYNYGQQSATISKNDISRPTRTNASSYNVYTSTNNGGIKIEKNRIHDLFAGLAARTTNILYNIYIGASGTASLANSVENNLVYNINNTDGTIYGVYGLAYNYWNYYHNTIVLDDAAATAGTTYAMYVYGTTATNVKNNIVFVSRGGSGTKYCLYYSTTGVTTSNNNVLYMASTAGTNGIGYYNSGYTTLANWQAANSAVYDQQSVSADPVFANPGASPANYTPTMSVVNDIGTSVGVTKDILDSTRSVSTPDAGAFEFSTITAGLNMGAESLVTPAVQANGCYTNAETVTVKIRNSSSNTINFATNPVTVTVNVTGAGTQTISTVVNTGTLLSDATMNVAIPTTVDMSAAGTYTFNANTSLSGDVNNVNDAMLPANRTKVALTAGTASGPSGFCVTSPVNPTLSSTGYGGQTAYQWVSSTTAVGGYTAIAGGTTVPYTVTSAPTQTMYYRLVATCGANTDSSAAVTVNYNNPQVLSTIPAARCGSGTVTLGATGSAGVSLEWFDVPSGGAALGTGTSFTTPAIAATTNYYVSANISGGGASAAILVTEIDLGTDDRLEIQNISPNAVDVTGWKVVVSNSYTDINSVNANVQTLSGVMNPGDTRSWTDATAGPNYWGSNILWNPGAYPTYTGWAAILDASNNLVDIVFLNWPSSNIQASNIIVNGTSINAGSKWTGNGIDQTTVAGTQSVSRQGNMDNNNLSDFAIINLTMGTTNTGMTIPFTGFACTSARTMVTATVGTPSSTAAGASGTTECATKVIAGSTDYNFTDCDPIAVITPTGASPITGSVNTCVTIDATLQTATTGEPYVQRHYNITPASNAATATSTITLYFLQSEFNAFNTGSGFYPKLPTGSADAAGKANLRITQFNGTGTLPGNYTGTATRIDPADGNIVWNAGANRWEITFAATGSGGFYVHTGSFVLPVTGLELKGEQSGAINRLSWTTLTETNNRGFELQRSADGASFSSLGFVASKGENGNSTSPLAYNFTDGKPFAGSSYYRVKQIDKDGRVTYSNTVLLGRKVNDIMLSAVYPNPATRELNLLITSPKVEKITIIITDLSGKVIRQQPVQLQAGENQQQLNVASLASGTYIVKAVCANGCETATHRFVKQ